MSLELNKIAAAVLVAGLIGMVVGKAADVLYVPEAPAKRGYTIAGAEEAGDQAAGSAAVEQPIDILPLIAAADAAKGQGAAKACLTCHTFEKGGKHGVGPNLWGVAGAAKGHRSDFAYSDALKQKGGIWSFQDLSDFLARPAKFIPGTKMSFIGIKKPEDRANVIRYLNEQGDRPLPIPSAVAPTPNAQEKAPAQ